jgi:hypothetical protein
MAIVETEYGEMPEFIAGVIAKAHGVATIVRPLDLETFNLSRGGHDDPGNNTPGECCLLEAAAWMAGEPWSDAPQCVCPTLAGFGRRLNDLLPDDRRQKLRRFVVPLLGTAGDGLQDKRRWMAVDWAVRTATPMWLDATGHTDRAAQLRALDPIDSRAAAAAARPLQFEIRDEMRALRTAALREIRSAAAAAAAVAAAAAAAVAAAAAAAAAVAVAAAAAAAVAVAAAAAAAAAAADAWRETYDRVYAATRARIEERFAPTVKAMQDSAIDLFGRMIHAGTPS